MTTQEVDELFTPALWSFVPRWAAPRPADLAPSLSFAIDYAAPASDVLPVLARVLRGIHRRRTSR